MSYLKLCQISNENYVETCDKEIVLANSISYPLIVKCEVIDWLAEEEFNKRGRINSFISEEVVINDQPLEIREYVYQELIKKYPELIK